MRGEFMTFNEAIKHFKNRSQMCKELDVTRQAVSLWAKKPDKPLPKIRQWQIEMILHNKGE